MSDKTEPSDDEREAIYQAAYGHDHDAMRHSARDVFWAGYSAGVAIHPEPNRTLTDGLIRDIYEEIADRIAPLSGAPLSTGATRGYIADYVRRLGRDFVNRPHAALETGVATHNPEPDEPERKWLWRDSQGRLRDGDGIAEDVLDGVATHNTVSRDAIKALIYKQESDAAAAGMWTVDDFVDAVLALLVPTSKETP